MSEQRRISRAIAETAEPRCASGVRLPLDSRVVGSSYAVRVVPERTDVVWRRARAPAVAGTDTTDKAFSASAMTC